MQKALRSPVPSRNLLRFLRSQSEGVPFFETNHSSSPGCALRRESRIAGHGRVKAVSVEGRARLPARSFSTSRPCRNEACLQASLFDFESLLPKSLQKQRPSPSTPPTKPCNVTALTTTGPGSQQRYASTDETPQALNNRITWQERLWGPEPKKPGKDMPPDGSDLADSTSIFNARRLQAAKAAMEPRLRCTEVDEHGNVILVDGEFKKSELIAKYGLLPRDLRKIDSSNLPHILVRPSAILLNLLHLKVLIKHDRVLLFDVYGSKTSYPQSAFMYDLQGKLQTKQPPGAGGLPYEFRALEAVLMSVTSELEADFDTVREPVIRVLSDLEDDIDREKLRVLLVLSKKVSTFDQKAKLVRDAIEELLEADDDLAEMYLTEKTHDLHRGEDDHTEVEMLLESYHKICDEVVQEASNLVSSIRNTEEIIRAILDANRNSLMLLDLKFSVGTLGLAMGTFLAGLYGMNLENFIEETNWGFAGVTGASTVFSLLVCWYGLVKLRKVQRVKMRSAEPPPRGVRPSSRDLAEWYGFDRPMDLLEAKNRERLRMINLMKNQTNMALKNKRWWN